ncbi:MAG: DNA polymerase III subunit gamma/tau [Ruminiclostridium sp.]
MYLALYRKYRPKTFDDVISQEHITTTLKNQLKNGQNSHAYLFTGSRGTGKTTCSKILAKAVNCLNPVDGNPCLECEACRAIEEESSDVTEIDAASNNGVDYVRDLKEEAVYAPISCKYRVYIIDEVHMLSTAAFNALLKLIEEPPPHVIFIFATTETHKVPATILSRCQRFEFRRIDINDSKKRLLDIAEKENVKLSEDAAFLISKISDGGMRDALSLLDQCISVSENITADVVRECAGISGSDYLFDISEKIENQDIPSLLKILDELNSRSKNINRLIEELIAHYRILMLLKAGADNSVIRVTDEELNRYRSAAESYTLGEIMRCISILSEFLGSMCRVVNPLLHAEMCFIRLASPKLDINEEGLNTRIELIEKKLEKISSGEISIAVNTPAAEVRKETLSSEIKEADPFPVEEIPLPDYAPVYNESVPGEEKPFEIKLPFESENVSEIRAEAPVESGSAETLGDVIKAVQEQKKETLNFTAPTESSEDFKTLEEWNEIIETIPFSIRILISDTTAKICGNTVLIEGGDLSVGYATGDFRREVEDAISKALGRKIVVQGKKNVRQDIDPDEKVNDFLDFARSQGVNIKEN